MATKKKTQVKKKQSSKKGGKTYKNANRQIFAVALFIFAAALLLLAVFGGGDGSAFSKVKEFYVGVFGFAAYVLPVFLFITAYFLSANPTSAKAVRFFVISSFTLTFISGLVFLICYDFWDDFTLSAAVANELESKTYSGLPGVFVGGILYKIIGSRLTAGVIDGFIAAVMFLLMSRTTVVSLFHGIGNVGTSMRDKAGREIENIREGYEKKSENPVEFHKPGKPAKTEKVKPEKPKKEKKQKTDDFENFTREDKVVDLSDGILSALKKRKTDENPEEKPLRQKTKKAAKMDAETGVVLFENVSEPEVPEKPEKPAEPDERQENLQSLIDNLYKKDIISGDTEEKPEKLKKGEVESAMQDVGAEIDEKAHDEYENYEMPPLDCLCVPSGELNRTSPEELKSNGEKLIAALDSFNVEARILDIVPGPSVTRYELSPASGVKINKFLSLSDDLALHLASPSGIRMEAPIPGKAAIGIEIPNRSRASVFMRDVLDTDEYRQKSEKSKLTVALGKDIAGSPVYADLAEMPHLLVAGTTGSGKSVCLNTMLVSILYNAKPDEVKLLLIDPKKVEFSIYNGIPHLLVPVVNDSRKAAGALAWAVTEMLNRYKIFDENRVRDIKDYNKLCDLDTELEKLPQIVIVIDELSDLMTVASAEVEDSITRLAQMARAAGMHLVVATQRPSVDVITGLIKANIPSRIALTVSSQIDSRTIIDQGGAEKLLGKGDMLFAPNGRPKPLRVQGCYLLTDEILKIVDFIKSQNSDFDYDSEIESQIESNTVPEKKKSAAANEGGAGQLVSSADADIAFRVLELFINNPDCLSVSAVQRKMSLGFARAGRIVDLLEDCGFVSKDDKKRITMLISPAEFMELRAIGPEAFSGKYAPGNILNSTTD